VQVTASPPGDAEELLDRVLDTGASLGADLTLSVADVDLAYVSLRALLASVETARGDRKLERGGTSVAERPRTGGGRRARWERPKGAGAGARRR
jgi:Gas vesicle protein